MGIQLFFSQTIEILADTLCESLQRDLTGSDPFVPVSIIVPNRNLEHWLKLRIASRFGAAVNIRFEFLEKGLWFVVQSVLGDPVPERLDQDSILIRILGVLLDPLKTQSNAISLSHPPESPESPLQDYLNACADSGDYSRRAWQLSKRLAGYFLEYENQREEMIDAWRANVPWHPSILRPDQIQMEQVQRALYRNVFHLDSESSKPGDSLTLAQCVAMLQQHDLPSHALPPKIRIFGLSMTAPLYLRLLFTLGSAIPVEVFELNACSEFWEDITTPAEARWMRIRAIPPAVQASPPDPESDFLEVNPDDNPLLMRWGKLGREKMKLLSELEERSAGRIVFDSHWCNSPDPLPARTLLTRIQQDILKRQSISFERLPQDKSIQIIGCPGVFREAEMVRDSIIDNLTRQPDLKLTDIAILVPDVELYKPALLSVFASSPCRIPFSMMDSQASTDSLYAQAVTALIELASGSFSRRQFFELAVNPCFLAGCGIERSDVEIWLEWAESLQVFRFWDARHKQESGLEATERFTWRHALMRLRLGRIMTVQKGDGEDAFPDHYHDLLPYSDLASGDPAMISRISCTIENLFSDLRNLAHGSLSGTQWSARMSGCLRQFLAAPRDIPAEESVQRALLTRLELLDALDRQLLEHGKIPEYGFAFIREFLIAELRELPSTRGKYLTGGVAISALRPMRPVPFRIVYIMGMGEGEFPGRPELSTLDLRLLQRKLGDICIPDANRYLFLETLLSTREKLYISYQHLDPRQDKIFHPCSVVNELRRYIETSLLPISESFRIRKIPLNSYDRSHLIVPPQQDADCSDIPACPSPNELILGLHIVKRNPADPLHTAAGTMLDDLTRDCPVLIRRTAGGTVEALDEPTPEPPATAITVSLRELAAFLIDPLKCIMRREYGIFDRGVDEALLAEFEPTVLDQLTAWQLKDEVIRSAFRHAADPSWSRDDFCTDLIEHWSRLGVLPEGFFGEVQSETIAQEMTELFSDDESGEGGSGGLDGLLNRIRSGDIPEYFRLRFGSQQSASSDVILVPAVSIDLPLSVRVHIDGGPYSVARIDDAWSVISATPSKMPQKPHIHKTMVEPFLALLALLCADPTPAIIGNLKSARFGIESYFRGGVVTIRPELTQETARETLTAILTDYLAHPPAFDLLPFDVAGPVFIAGQSVDETSEPAAFKRAVEESLAAQGDSQFGGYRAPSITSIALDIHVPHDALAKIARRLGLLLNARITLKKPSSKPRRR